MKKYLVFITLMGLSLPSVVKAEEPTKGVSLELGGEVVTSYIWRGQECGGFSMQPSATLNFGNTGLSFGAWASIELCGPKEWANMTEFDLSLAWSKGDLSLALNDYSFCTGQYWGDWKFNNSACHNFEANVAYDFGFASLSWNTVLTGPDHILKDDQLKRNYSTFVEVNVPWKIKEIVGQATVGASLWGDAFTSADGSEGFKIYDIGLSASKSLNDHLTLNCSVITNPQTDRTYFVVGLAF